MIQLFVIHEDLGQFKICKIVKSGTSKGQSVMSLLIVNKNQQGSKIYQKIAKDDLYLLKMYILYTYFQATYH